MSLAMESLPRTIKWSEAPRGLRDSMDVNLSGMFVATRSRQPRGPLDVRWVGNVTSWDSAMERKRLHKAEPAADVESEAHQL